MPHRVHTLLWILAKIAVRAHLTGTPYAAVNDGRGTVQAVKRAACIVDYADAMLTDRPPRVRETCS